MTMIPKKRDSSGTARRLGDVGLGQRAAPAEPVEHAGKFVGQRFEQEQSPNGENAAARTLAERRSPRVQRGDRELSGPGWAGLWEWGVGESMAALTSAVPCRARIGMAG